MVLRRLPRGRRITSVRRPKPGGGGDDRRGDPSTEGGICGGGVAQAPRQAGQINAMPNRCPGCTPTLTCPEGLFAVLEKAAFICCRCGRDGFFAPADPVDCTPAGTHVCKSREKVGRRWGEGRDLEPASRGKVVCGISSGDQVGVAVGVWGILNLGSAAGNGLFPRES